MLIYEYYSKNSKYIKKIIFLKLFIARYKYYMSIDSPIISFLQQVVNMSTTTYHMNTLNT